MFLSVEGILVWSMEVPKKKQPIQAKTTKSDDWFENSMDSIMAELLLPSRRGTL